MVATSIARRSGIGHDFNPVHLIDRWRDLEWRLIAMIPPVVAVTILSLCLPVPNQPYKVGLERGAEILRYLASSILSTFEIFFFLINLSNSFRSSVIFTKY